MQLQHIMWKKKEKKKKEGKELGRSWLTEATFAWMDHRCTFYLSRRVCGKPSSARSLEHNFLRGLESLMFPSLDKRFAMYVGRFLIETIHQPRS